MPENITPEEEVKDGNGIAVKEGDRVEVVDFNFLTVQGVFRKNTHPATKEAYPWSVLFDDGEEYCVMDFWQIFKK